MGLAVPRKDAWSRARDRFVEDLTKEEQALFERATPETIFYDASAAEKTHVSKSSSLKAVDKLQPLISAIEQYGQALDVYSNAYPLVMSPLWGSIRILLFLAREFGKYFEKTLEMLARIGDVLPRFKVYEDLFATHERLVQALSVAYLDILAFCTKAKGVFRHGRRSSLTNLSIAFKLSWKPFERQFGEQIDGFRTHVKNVEKEASLSHMVEAAESRSVVLANKQQLEKMKKESQHRRMIAAIPSVNHEGKHKKLQNVRYEGTGTWILRHETFQQWKRSASSSILCCHGIPGCGKTVLASTMVDDLRENANRDARLAYYYCDYADQRTLQIENILGTLLKQFFLDGCIPGEVEAQLPPHLGEFGQALDLNSLMTLISVAARSSKASFVILDGLDECEKLTEQHMIQLIQDLVGFKTVKIVVFCREEDELLRYFHGNPTIRISSPALERDIESFVKGSVKARIESGQLRIRNPHLEQEIVAELISKARGMFLWVFFQLDELCEAPSDAIIRRTLRDLPDGLGETYERILTKIEQKRMKKQIARKVFLWVLCARRPLRIEEIQEAVAFEPTDASWDSDKIPDSDLMLQSCRGLVTRDMEEGTVHFAHHTVRQYLLSDAANQRKPCFYYTIEQAELDVGEMCLTYLSFSDFCTQIQVRNPDLKPERPPEMFKSGATLWIPNLIGVRSSLLDIPYRLLGASFSSSPTRIDLEKLARPAANAHDTGPSPDLLEKYRLLEYIIEHWMFFTMRMEAETPELYNKMQDMARHKTLSFEFRPWGANQHNGPHGCRSCSPGIDPKLMAQKLPFMSLFHYAAEFGHWPLIEPLVVDYCAHEDGDDHTLVTACRQGHHSIVKALMSKHTFDISNGKAVEAAAAAGNPLILDHLLGCSDLPLAAPRVSKRYDLQRNGHIPLCLAASNGHEKIVHDLFGRGAPINRKMEVSGKTAIAAAAGGGHQQIVRFLMDRGARTFTNLTTPLHCAAENGHDIVVRMLMEQSTHFANNDIPPNVLNIIPHMTGALDQQGETPMHRAARNGHDSVVKVLLDFVPLTGKNDILSATSNVSYPGEQAHGLSAIHLAASNGHVGVMGLLAEHISLDSRTTRGRTALHVAADAGCASSIQWLLSNNAGTKTQDEDGYTALQIATVRGYEEAVRILIEHTGVTDSDLEKCFVLAARKGHEDLIALLLDDPHNDIFGRRHNMACTYDKRHRLLEQAIDIAVAEDQPEAAALLNRLRGRKDVISSSDNRGDEVCSDEG